VDEVIRRRSSLLLLAAVLMACTPQNGAPGATPGAGAASGDTRVGDTTLVGTVRVVGSAPVNLRVVLQHPDGGTTELAGALKDELRSLSGAEVAVRGTLTGGVLSATAYEIRAVDGAPVVMGVIESIEDGTARLRTAAGATVLVAGVPASFRVGQKVWVQGPQSIRVQSYGVIRP
jgi:hypothetical protein